jgi:hypothetical protein
MIAEEAYAQTAMANRGFFAEEFAAERLERVFGTEHVFQNVHIWEAKGRKLGEIDTLVIFGHQAIVVQAKSKRLTIAARKGNDLQLHTDFKAAVQDACDQAYLCSEQVPASIKAIYPVCLVSDHYPALSFQARQFLVYKTTEVINPPLVCDVFFLDVATEMLETPLRCLSYLELRAMAGDNVMLSHENTALGYHLKKNLWLGEFDTILLPDDVAADLDVAMAVRRDGVDGQSTPPGILTELRDLTIGHMITEMEKKFEPAALEIGLELVKMSGDSARDISRLIDRIVSQAAKDSKEHDASFGFSKARGGITVHCNELPDAVAAAKLRRHCELRKYSPRKWCGMALNPAAALRFGLMLDYPWVADQEIDKVVENMPKGFPPDALLRFSRGISRPGKKLGKYQRCPCGGMMKYIKCCLRNGKIK